MDEYVAFVKEYAREPVTYVNPVGYKQKKEHDIKQRWCECDAHVLFEKYKGVLLEEIPPEHRPIIAQLRQMWLEIDGAHVMEEYFSFIDIHGREPIDHSQGKNILGKSLSTNGFMETDLVSRWNRCFEKQVMDRFSKCMCIQEEYKEIIDILREHDLAYPESYNTRMFMKITRNTGFIPRQAIFKNGNKVLHKNYDSYERYETYVRAKFEASDDKKIYDAYKLGILSESEMCIYENMIQELNEIYQINVESKAKLSAIRKEEYKHKIKRELISKRAEERARAESLRQTLAPKKMEPEASTKVQEQVNKEPKNAPTKIQEQVNRKQLEIEVAKMFIKFVKKHKKLPHGNIRRKGVDVGAVELTDEEKAERALHNAWNNCNFMETVDTYAGVPIERVPEEYREVVSEFRSEGFGLTADEYFEFRSNRAPKDILLSVRTKRDMSARKKAKAMELDEEILQELRKREKDEYNR